MPTSPPGIWSKLDDFIYEVRWYIVAVLLSVACITGGFYVLKHGDHLFSRPTSVLDPTAPQPAGETTQTAAPQAGPVNINTATESELESLPRIGPAIAQRIIDYRTTHGPFKKIEDITNVSGIGPKTFADLAARITVQ